MQKSRLDIWIMNPDGTHAVRVTRHLGPYVFGPNWQRLP